MGSRTALVVALVLGAAAAFLFREVLQNLAPQAGLERGGTIVVTRSAVPFGATLTAENLREVPWSSATPLEGSFPTIMDMLRDGRRLALASLQRNEPVLSSRVTGPNQRATLSTQLDDGMRAVTVRVDEVRGVAGFVLPGDRVDVILTRGEVNGQEGAAYADVLLQSAKVLAVDQLVDERQDKPAIARAVTLELTGKEAQKVVLAQGIGRLSLALRQAIGAAQDDAVRVTANDLGLAASEPRDRIAELEKRLAEAAAGAEAARSQANQTTAQKLSDLETRLRGEMAARPSGMSFAAPSAPQPRPTSTGSVVNVIRNGSKSESYNVAAER